jgi:guanylate kinase
MSGQIHVISGPSGVGKSTIIEQLKERLPDLAYSISHTSRTPRFNETDGVHYNFVDKNRFKKMIDEGAFVEWAQVYNDLYGTSFTALHDQLNKGSDVLLDIDIQGAKSIKKHFPESCLIFILPPSFDILEKRLRHRSTEDDATIKVRIKDVHEELKAFERYDYLIINDDLKKAIEETISVIIACRSRTSRVLPHVRELFSLQGGDK